MGGRLPASHLVRLWIVAVFAVLLVPSSASAWVPGTQGPILFSSLEGVPADPVGPHIWTVKPDGTGKRELTHGVDDWPAWSPSGREFVFARQESFGGPVRSRLMVADNSGGDVHLLTDPLIAGSSGDLVLGDSMARWSPDGTQIAFVRSDLSGNNIWAMNADGSDEHQLTDFASTIGVRGLAWSPDSHKLVFSTGIPLGPSADPSSGGAIYEMTAAGASIHQVIPTGLYPPGVDWAPAGFVFGTNFEGISVVQLDGSGSPQTFGDPFPSSPSWAPDATSSSDASLVYLVGGVTHTDLVSTSTADPTQQELTFDGFVKQSDSWGPGLPHFHPDTNGFTIRRPAELGKVTIPLVIHCPHSAGNTGCLDAVIVRFGGHILTTRHVKLRQNADRELTLHLGPSAGKKLRLRGRISLSLISKVRGHTTTVRQVERVLESAALTAHFSTHGATVGKPVSFSGTLTSAQRDAQTASAAAQRIGVVAFGPDGEAMTVVLHTHSGGGYSGRFMPDVPGRWLIQAVWYGDSKHVTTASLARQFEVAPRPRANTTLSLTCPGKATAKTALKVSGAIRPAFAGARITVAYSHPSGGSSIVVSHHITTSAMGTFSDSITPNETGEWDVQAIFGGDTRHSGSGSAVCKNTVEP